MDATRCSEPDCLSAVKARGYCSAHYQAAMKRGTITARPKTPPGHCPVPDCVYAGQLVKMYAGMCSSHYQTKKKYGDPLARKQRAGRRPCSVNGCTKDARKRGWCEVHYERVKRTGETGPGHLLRDMNSTRLALSTGYVKVKAPGHPRGYGRSDWVYEHVVVMEQKIGRHLLPGENVHHINGVRADNRPSNLELWVTKQPAGQRPEDLVAWAKEILARYDTGGAGCCALAERQAAG